MPLDPLGVYDEHTDDGDDRSTTWIDVRLTIFAPKEHLELKIINTAFGICFCAHISVLCSETIVRLNEVQ